MLQYNGRREELSFMAERENLEGGNQEELRGGFGRSVLGK
jgi:hypothetical protein